MRVSLFCYPHAPVNALLDAWVSSPTPVTCLVPQGVATEQVDAWLGAAASLSRGSLTLRRIPFLPQGDYDRLLWSCDINFVRGEDSFVRAHWADRPFVWHIYPQDKNLHHVKLNAFLQRCDMQSAGMQQLWLSWNDVIAQESGFGPIWEEFKNDRTKIVNMARQWQTKLLTIGDLARNLMQFAGDLRLKNQQNTL